MYAGAGYTPQSPVYHQPPHPQQPASHQQQAAAAKAKADSAKLQSFLSECLAVGTLKGFKYFELYLRGREELVLRVYNDPDGSTALTRQPSTRELARSQSRNLLASRSHHRLLWQSTDALPPASPCDRELERNSNYTAFLVAGYAKYKSPFVWLRTNHAKFARWVDESATKEDVPVKLDTVNKWKNSDSIHVADILAELLNIAMSPPPLNPFAINHALFDELPLEESVVSTAAMLDFLQKVYLSDAPHAHHLLADIERLQQRLWTETAELSATVPTGAASPRRTSVANSK
ncbi:hypothetical protein H9P43_007660 [Blastocladiella emersonii ATCC 22665]|nr:hypothetical protein H9P43_007660 [Blastocladiella emersonii ATCC 22665]